MSAVAVVPLLRDVERELRELFELVGPRPELEAEMRAVLERVMRDLAQRLESDGCTVLLAGEPDTRRALLDVFLGASVLGAARKRPLRTITRVRAGAAIDYVARVEHAGVERFRDRLPDRSESFAKAIARAERERDEAAAVAMTKLAALEAAKREIVIEQMPPPAAPQPAAPPHTQPRGVARLWALFVAWIVALFGTRAAPALPQEETDEPTQMLPARLAELEDARRAAAAELVRAREHVVELEAERDRYAAERSASFFADLRALGDAAARGAQVLELDVELPCALPPGVVLVDAPDAVLDADGCLFVAEDRRRASVPSLGAGDDAPPLPFFTVAKDAATGEVVDRIEHIRREAPLVVCARAIAFARRAITSAVERAFDAERDARVRLSALSSQRLADPEEFRARAKDQLETSIDETVRALLHDALLELDARIAELRADWRAQIEACTDRGALDACMQAIDGAASARLAAIGDAVNALVIARTQQASDAIAVGLVADLQQRYRVAQRDAVAAAAPVVADALSDSALKCTTPLAGAVEAFEQRRVGYGLGGAAAGALLGTVIAPVIGTAIGAFFGVFAGFLKGIATLRQECLARIDASLDRVGQDLHAELARQRGDLERGLRTFLEESLDATMKRFERSIARLLEVEKRTLAAQRDKLADLASLLGALERHEERLRELAARAELPLAPRPVRRSEPSIEIS